MHFRHIAVLALVVTVAGCGSSYSSPPATTAPTPAAGGGTGAVSIVNGASTRSTNAYSPNPITVAVGGSVTWTNTDAVAHTATSDTGVWTSGSIAPGSSFSRTFPAAGTFPYHCTIHPGMVGAVTVQ